MKSILVSIIIPSFNRAHYIEETILSIINQSFKKWELIIVDDGSTDGSLNVITEFLNDPRIKLVNRPHDRPGGGNAARNYGYEISKGQYIKWLDSDDLLAPHCLEKQVQFLHSHPYDVVFSRSRFFDKVDNNNQFSWGKYWSDFFPKEDPFENYLTGKIRFSTADGLWRRGFLGEKPHKENLRNSQEWLMLITQLKKDPVYLIDDEVLVYSRMHEDQMHSHKNVGLYYRHQGLARYYAIKDLSKSRKLTATRAKYLFKSMVYFFFRPLLQGNFKYIGRNFLSTIKTLRYITVPIIINVT